MFEFGYIGRNNSTGDAICHHRMGGSVQMPNRQRRPICIKGGNSVATRRSILISQTYLLRPTSLIYRQFLHKKKGPDQKESHADRQAELYVISEKARYGLEYVIS